MIIDVTFVCMYASQERKREIDVNEEKKTRHPVIISAPVRSCFSSHQNFKPNFFFIFEHIILAFVIILFITKNRFEQRSEIHSEYILQTILHQILFLKIEILDTGGRTSCVTTQSNKFPFLVYL